MDAGTARAGTGDFDPVDVARVVATQLEALGIPYVLGGSLASTLYGEPRTTLNVDFALQLQPEQADALTRALGADFYVDAAAVHEAAPAPASRQRDPQELLHEGGSLRQAT